MAKQSIGEKVMPKQDLSNTKFQAHIKAVEDHKLLVEKLNEADANVQLDEINYSLKNLTLTLEEYFKVLGIP